MPIMMSELRAALIEAGATEERADRAATEAATYETRLAGLESKVTLLVWMVGLDSTVLLAVAYKVFNIHG